MAPQHSPQRWLEMKPYIRQLYVAEGRQLREVDVVMRRDHGFHASERMYKQRLRQWKFQVKSVKDSEWQVMNTIWEWRRASSGKDTEFWITKSGVRIRKVKKDIDKHFKRADRVNMPLDTALNYRSTYVTIDWATPPASPLLPAVQHLPPPARVAMFNASPGTGEGLHREPFAPTLHDNNPPLHRSPDLGQSPFRDDASPLSATSGSEASDLELGPDPSGEPSPPSSVENLTFGFRSLALKLIEPGSCRFSADDELLLNQLLSGAVESQPGIDIGMARISRRGSSFMVEFEALEEPLVVASDWAAHIFLWCYWTNHHHPARAQASRTSALVSFRHMLRNPNDNVHTGLSWLITILPSHGHAALLRDFLEECCRMIDAEGKTPFYGPLYRYSLAFVADNEADLIRYGNQLEHCHHLIRNVYNDRSASWLVSNYFIASHCLHIGDSNQALARLQECLPLSEQRMGRNHLMTINCLAILHRTYWAQGANELAMTIMKDAVDRCEQALGKQSPYRLQLLSVLAGEYAQIGRLDEAQNILREVLEDQIKFMGLIDNQRTWWTIDELEKVLRAQGKEVEAAEFKAEINQRRDWAWTYHLRAQERLANG